MKLKPGKLYQVISDGIYARNKQFLGLAGDSGLYKIPSGTIFLYIDKFEQYGVTYSRILLDDKIVITYNGYLLRKHIKEVEPKNERIPSTDC